MNPDYVRAVKRLVNRCPYFELISMEIRSLALGRSRLEVKVQKKHLQPFGIVHGGVYSSVMDAAAFWAVYPLLEEGLGLTTVEIKLNFLSPAAEGYLVAKGRNIKIGKTLCLAEASIFNREGVFLAHGVATMMILRDLKLEGEQSLPSKFLEAGRQKTEEDRSQKIEDRRQKKKSGMKRE
ncbi:MAG: PaaI family thioesterase [Desulfobacterales bacterium]|nr:PaaI family thioesterase [Desulfobacterales bacterium]